MVRRKWLGKELGLAIVHLYGGIGVRFTLFTQFFLAPIIQKGTPHEK
jgi:hypothetical protein